MAPRMSEVKTEAQLFSIFSLEQMSGAEELYKVGRCLDLLYPDELDRAELREEVLEELRAPPALHRPQEPVGRVLERHVEVLDDLRLARDHVDERVRHVFHVVKKGETLVKLDTEKLTEQIKELELDQPGATIAMDTAVAELAKKYAALEHEAKGPGGRGP